MKEYLLKCIREDLEEISGIYDPEDCAPLMRELSEIEKLLNSSTPVFSLVMFRLQRVEMKIVMLRIMQVIPSYAECLFVQKEPEKEDDYEEEPDGLKRDLVCVECGMEYSRADTSINGWSPADGYCSTCVDKHVFEGLG